ncbi:archaeosortase/exosortase family protein [Hymenobacter sp. BT188]|uniref:archaeosortase/exosortase family protein n=1 Tax=Hymenobacter sp. BT188 TaxID=2763504 RepID=UPI003966C66B
MCLSMSMQEPTQIRRFLLTALCLCLGWFILYDLWLSGVDTWLSLRTVETSSLLLRGLGHEIYSQHGQLLHGQQVLVYMMPACNGMVLMALFAGFILAFPGAARVGKKLAYTGCGILIIYALNVLRVAGLALNVLYGSHEMVQFNHKYAFSLVVYACIFGLWMVWVKRYALFAPHGTHVV